MLSCCIKLPGLLSQDKLKTRLCSFWQSSCRKLHLFATRLHEVLLLALVEITALATCHEQLAMQMLLMVSETLFRRRFSIK